MKTKETTTGINNIPRGFTLIEICIVMVISSIALTASLDLVKQFRAHKVIAINSERIETIRKTIATYVKNNDRLPCPARRDLATRSPAYGTESCVAAAAPATVSTAGAGGRPVRIGAVPVREIGLSDEYATDIWGNQFTYAVTEGLMVAPLNPLLAAINVVDAAGVSVMTAPGPTAAMYAVTDPGKDAKGAWSVEGKPMTVCTPGASDSENCDDDATFRVAPYSTVAAAQHFDDQISFSTGIEDTTLPMCGTTGTLTSKDGLTFVCEPFPPPPPGPGICAANERLTSPDGINFVCEALPPFPPAPAYTDPPTCTAAQMLTSPDGVTLICAAMPAPPPAPPALPICPASQRLYSANGTTFVCKDVDFQSQEVVCKGVLQANGRYGCTADCNTLGAGWDAAGGGILWGQVFARNGGEASVSGNGYRCQVIIDSCSADAPDCDMGCSATCVKMK